MSFIIKNPWKIEMFVTVLWIVGGVLNLMAGDTVVSAVMACAGLTSLRLALVMRDAPQ